MTRTIPGLLWFQLIVLFAGGCGPEPIRPRPLVAPPVDAAAPDTGRPDAAPQPTTAAPPDAGQQAVKDVGAAKDAGVEVPGDADSGTAGDAGSDAATDSRESRPKLPAPDGGIPAPEVDASGGADAVDAEATDAGSRTPVTRRPAAGEVRIAEVQVNPAGQDSGHEWIEIASRAAEPLDLSALHLADAAGDVAAPAGIIQPGARLVLAQSLDVRSSGDVPVSIFYGTRLALNNDGDEISICIGPCADGVVIDRVSWGALGAAYDGHALVIDLETNRTCPASESYGIAAFGTPGAPDSGCGAPDGGI